MTLAVVSHDAGGAEILSSYVRSQGIRALFVLEGPARAVFARKLGQIDVVPLDEAIAQCSAVLCGTSWQSDLEFAAIAAARHGGKHCTAFIDHWVNYADRFRRGEETRHPDEIWVGDSIAAEMARREFPHLTVRCIDNPYFEDIRAELSAWPPRPRSEGGPQSLLYVCEPIREHAALRYGDERHFGYVEEEALRFFLENIALIAPAVERIRIRPHPSEAGNKYDWARGEFALPIEQGGTRTLVAEVSDCDIVVGCESMAMVVGLLADKRVVSCIPSGGRPCRLPHPQIERLSQLATAAKT
jgi:hypothetical protein